MTTNIIPPYKQSSIIIDNNKYHILLKKLGRHRYIIILIVAIIPTMLFLGSLVKEVKSEEYISHTIVIDAGHGGIDGGSVGVITKNDENHLNLEYAKCLKSYFENFGFGVVMTRNNLDGLYSPFAKNKKKDDMKKRSEIINSCGADFVVSIHMNSFPSRLSKGAQTFYRNDNKAGKNLASSIQSQFIKNIPDARTEIKTGDYFILNCTTLPAVIVECGFLSNPDEDKLLETENHKQKICYSIFCGVIIQIGVENI